MDVIIFHSPAFTGQTKPKDTRFSRASTPISAGGSLSVLPKHSAQAFPVHLVKQIAIAVHTDAS
jgi:c-di-GMP-binding flagellar brake protein YcgR